MAEISEDIRRALLLILAQLEPDQRARLSADLKVAEIEAGNAVGSIFEFRLPGYRALARSGQRPLSPEGKVCDADGELLDVVIYVDANGRLCELELLRWADGYVIEPDWRTFRL